MIHRPGDHIVSVSTAAAFYPISLTEMKEHLRVVGNDDDTYIDGLTAAAVASLGHDGELGRAIITTTIDEALQFPTRDVYLSILPVASLVSVTYYDGDNAEQTATLADFTLYKSDDWAFVRSDNWPSPYDRPDAITIQYVAGQDRGSVPENIIHAIKLVVGHWYQNRENASDVKLTEIPLAAGHLLGLSRRGWYG